MARIDWVRHRLDNWARWARERESGSLGYPSTSPMFRLTPRSGGYDSREPSANEEDAWLVELAVQSLRYTHSHLYKTIRHYYIDGYDIKRVAKIMIKAESTIKAHLEASDRQLALWFRPRDEAAAAHPGARR